MLELLDNYDLDSNATNQTAFVVRPNLWVVPLQVTHPHTGLSHPKWLISIRVAYPITLCRPFPVQILLLVLPNVPVLGQVLQISESI